jgi:hypothetical protein
MSRMQKPFIGLAALLAGTYLMLAVFSVACAIDHAERGSSSHHHGSTVFHSSFCAWACQANPTSDAGPSDLVLHPFLVVAFFVESNRTAVASGGVFCAASRAPPVHS